MTIERIAELKCVIEDLCAQVKERDARVEQLEEATFAVLDGWTLPGDARKLLQAAYYAEATVDRAQSAQAVTSITIDFKQTTKLLDMFGNMPSEITLTVEEGHSGHGLYAHCTEYPEDGSEYLGLSSHEALPDPALALPTPKAETALAWDGKLHESLQQSLNALRLECPPELVNDLEFEVRKSFEALSTSLTTAKRMYGAARDRLEAIDASQQDPFAARLAQPAVDRHSAAMRMGEEAHKAEPAPIPKYQTPHDFKNFHRQLCARFGYVHDEQFWWRDLVSLIEHIASKAQPAVEPVAEWKQSTQGHPYWPHPIPHKGVPLPDGWLDDYITDCAKLNPGEMPGVYFVQGVRFAEQHHWGTSPAPAPNALDAETAIKNCLEAGETMRVLKRVVNLLLESRRNLGPEDHELRDRIDQLFRPDAAIAAQSAQGG